MLKHMVTMAAALTLMSQGAAFAHAYPRKEAPPKGATVTAAPPTLWIEFDDALEPHFTGVTVTNAQGARVDEGHAKVSAADPHHLSVGLKPLAPGRYTVHWHATDTDTHKTQGSYSFTVAP